jgi:hypothetical protein
VLSFASVHNVALHTRARPSLLSFASVHHVALHEGARPSVLSFASVHNVALHEDVPPCYHSHLIMLRYTRGTPSVLSFASHHNCCVTKGNVPPCYHSHLFIKLRYTEGARPSIIRICSSCCVHVLCFIIHLIGKLRYERPPCYHSHLFIMLRYTKGTSLRAIIRICSCVTRRARPSVLSFASVHHVSLHENVLR